jgi:indolepyruvate ferredoxin oxidoreductase
MLGYAWQKGWVPLAEASILKAIELNGVSVDFNRQAFVWGRTAAHDPASVEKLARASAPAQVIEFKRSPALDDVIARRVAFLTDYQNAAYARQYSDFVAQVRQAESAVAEAGKPLRLTETVARYYFKLMAYKDEYEVARLHADPAFAQKIAGMFEGDYKVKFHMAPPLLARRDSKGHLVKREFGPWMMGAFRLLSRLRWLRGSALDVFGYTAERRTERELIVHYRETLVGVLPRLSLGNLGLMIALAAIPEDIRGYGHVKERHLVAARAKEGVLLAQLRGERVGELHAA